MLEHKLAEIDWPVAIGLFAFGFTCWLAGWHMSLRGSGRMYDTGYRAGYTDRGKFGEEISQRNANSLDNMNKIEQDGPGEVGKRCAESPVLPGVI